MPHWNPAGERRWPGQQPYAHRCLECGDIFDAVMPHAVLCSNRCAQRAVRRRRKEARQNAGITERQGRGSNARASG
jgi:predicted  nucleic acid-binding Zn-ribbon protein